MHTKGINETIAAAYDATIVQFLDVCTQWRADRDSSNVHTSLKFCWKKLSLLYHDMYFVNTTFRVFQHNLKPGPLQRVITLGKTAPIRIMQIPQEDGESINNCSIISDLIVFRI